MSIENVLFDSGASISVIREDVARAICKVKDFAGKAKKPLTLADGQTELMALGTCDFGITIDKKLEIDDMAWVVEVKNKEKQPKMIIGASTMQRFNIQLKHAERSKGGDKLIFPETEQEYTLFSVNN